MAVNALGQMVNLVLAPGQAPAEALANLGLVAGQSLQAKIVDIFPDQRAVINLKGLNLVAQLPAPQASQAFQKGQSLDLLVTQAPQPRAAQGNSAANPPAASSTQDPAGNTRPSNPQSPGPQPAAQANQAPVAAAPALSFKLLGISQGPTLAFAEASQSPPQAALPRQVPQVIEQALSQARLLPHPANIRAAESLLRHGLSLDPASLTQVIRTAESLISTESAPLPAPQAGGQRAWPAGIQSRLEEAATLLTLLSTQANRAAERPQIQGLLRTLNQLMAPQAPAAPALEMASLASPSPEPGNLLARLDASLQSVSSAKPGSLPGLESLVRDLQAARPAIQAQAQLAAAAQPAQNPALPMAAPQGAALSAAASLPPSLRLPVAREAAVMVFEALRPQMGQGITQTQLLTALATLDQAAQAPAATLPEALRSAVSAQVPQAAPLSEPLPALRAAFSEIAQAFSAKPLAAPLRSMASLETAFAERELPAPGLRLSLLPLEDVVDAVVFLKARQLPPARPMVEAVAREIGKETDLAATGRALVQGAKELPAGFLALKPGLSSAAQALEQSLSRFESHPASPKFWQDLRRAAMETGLNLESSLANPQAEDASAPQIGAPSKPEEGLKAGLLRFRDEARTALAHKAALASPEISAKLEGLVQEAGRATDAISALQLSARPTPAFEVTNLPLPLALNSQLQGGNLSVFWRKGKPHELDSKDPVNVVFLLNTRALGEVKVQLQVWKEECRCKVVLPNDEARRFVESGAPELRQAMEDNTPFTLSSIDIETASGEALPPLPFAPAGPGLSLNA